MQFSVNEREVKFRGKEMESLKEVKGIVKGKFVLWDDLSSTDGRFKKINFNKCLEIIIKIHLLYPKKTTNDMKNLYASTDAQDCGLITFIKRFDSHLSNESGRSY